MAKDLRLASRLVLPAGNWPCLLDFLCCRFPHISRSQWQHRFERELILAADATPLQPQQPCLAGLQLFYFREVPNEQQVPFQEQILFEDELLLVVDKPHFLTLAPVGQYVEQTLLRRLQQRYADYQLSPLHRLDRLTAGVVMLCKQPEWRDAYQQLFRLQQVYKSYEAIAPPLPRLAFPCQLDSRMQRHHKHFFLSEEVPGPPNVSTKVNVLQRGSKYWYYLLEPLTGYKHQLRLHMSSLGAAIVWDDFYPRVAQRRDDFSQPLQLLARSLAFTDPVTGQQRSFASQRSLQLADSLD